MRGDVGPIKEEVRGSLHMTDWLGFDVLLDLVKV